MRERRFVKGSEVRTGGDSTPTISGYASVFNEVYDAGYFREIIKPGAFARALREGQDVRMLLNHDANFILGRTKADTLTLKEDTKGLSFDCTLPDTQAAKDVRTLIQRGDLDGCSFAFQVVKQTWREERENPSDPNSRMIQYRDIEDLDLMDASVVTYPAYEGTSVGARSLWPDGVPAEIRSHIPALSEIRITEEPGSDSAPAHAHRDDEMGECDCTCEACSGCTQRNQPTKGEVREEEVKENVLSIDVAKARVRAAELSLQQ